WRPSHLLMPSPADHHPDHSATAVLVHLALNGCRQRPAVITYRVHGWWAKSEERRYQVRVASVYQRAKQAAMNRHQTQLLLSRPRLWPTVQRPEVFEPLDAALCNGLPHPVLSVAALDRECVELRIRTRP